MDLKLELFVVSDLFYPLTPVRRVTRLMKLMLVLMLLITALLFVLQTAVLTIVS